MTPPALPLPRKPRHQQNGAALITVLIMMLLAILLAFGSARVGLLNERLSGNSTDYQRAYEAAEALLADARLDVACMSSSCDKRAASTQLTCDAQQYFDLQASLASLTPACKDGICKDLGTDSNGDPSTSFWNDDKKWAAYTADNRGARFGQYTGATIDSTKAVNPLLLDRGWYWIEILRYGGGAGSGRSVASEQNFSGDNAFRPHTGCEFVFRVTAVAQGRRSGTKAVLQSLYFFRPA